MPSSHPEADVLTAFLENGLSGKDRQQVMEHLATCDDCREIVFLAQPEMTQETFTPARARRFRWMAWTSAAAVVVVVGSAVVLQHERVTNPESPAPIATTSSKVETKAPEAGHQRDTAALASSKIRVEHATAPPSAPTGAEREAKGKAPAETQFAITSKKDESAIAEGELRAPKPAPPAAAPVVQGQSAGGLIPQQNVTGPMRRNAQAAQQQPFQGPANSANANLTDGYAVDGNANAPKMAAPAVAKDQKKEAAGGAVGGIVSGYARAPIPASTARARMAPVQWRISESGQLERSSGGTTWTPVLEEAGRKFHVVSVVGNMVWAGGNKGVLFVSRDGGGNWKPVNIETSGDILSIQFADLMNGSLQTSDGETWKTSDGGKSWQKQ